MYELVLHNSFKRDIKRCKKRGLDFQKMEKVIDLLIEKGNLPPKLQTSQIDWKLQGFLGMPYKIRLAFGLATR